MTSLDYIIKVNINRLKEGLRVIEDIARFILCDNYLFTSIKSLRHSIDRYITIQPNVNSFLLKKDIGGIDHKENTKSKNLFIIIEANLRRVQESSRVLEELFDQKFYKKIRFEAYELQSKLISSLKMHYNRNKLNGFYVICNPEIQDLEYIANKINNKNIKILQVRMNSSAKNKIYNTIIELKKLISSDVLLILNDHLDLALVCASGVHLGQNDFPIEQIQTITAKDFVVGITVHNIEEAKIAIYNNVNYLSVGCIFDTKTKHGTIKTDIFTLKDIINMSPIPVAAIGGINRRNIEQLKGIGLDMYAVYSSFWNIPKLVEN